MNHKLSQRDHDWLDTFLKSFTHCYFMLRLFFVNNYDRDFQINGGVCGRNRSKSNAARLFFFNIFFAVGVCFLLQNDLHSLHPGSFRKKTQHSHQSPPHPLKSPAVLRKQCLLQGATLCSF